jgi:N-acetylneuraminic acid mutarotase
MGADGVMLNDTWTYDVARNIWTKLTPASPPSVRFGSKLVYDPSSGKFVLFGGTYLRTNPNGYFQQDFNDTWTFDLAADTWTALSPSGTPPDGHAATESLMYDEANSKMLVLQGLQPLTISPPYVPPDKLNKDWFTFAYDPRADSWASSSRSASSPPISQNYALAFDPAARRAILFGGSDPGRETHGDTWALDVATNAWTMALAGGPDRPPGRVDSAMAYDAKTKTMILFGGRSADGKNADVPDDTWEYVP